MARTAAGLMARTAAGLMARTAAGPNLWWSGRTGTE
jgi:hypothetical protein